TVYCAFRIHVNRIAFHASARHPTRLLEFELFFSKLQTFFAFLITEVELHPACYHRTDATGNAGVQVRQLGSVVSRRTEHHILHCLVFGIVTGDDDLPYEPLDVVELTSRTAITEQLRVVARHGYTGRGDLADR